MKKLSFKAMKGILLGSGVATAACACVVAVNVNNSFKTTDGEKISVVESEAIEAQDVKVLADAEKEVSESKVEVEQATKAIEVATEAKETAEMEVAVAEEELTKAEEAKKLAEAEVKNAKTEEERNVALEKVKETEEALTKATENKEEAEAKVQKAAKAVMEAENNKKEAEQRVKKAEENKKSIEEEIRKNSEVEEQKQQVSRPEPAKEEAETKEASVTETKGESQNSETKTESQNNNTTVADSSTGESRSLTDEQLKRMLEAAALGEKEDREAYEKAYSDKYGHLPEEKHEVEFHFYSNLNPLTVRLYDHNNYYTESKCGLTGSGCIWFAEFSCDLNQCVGFLDSYTGKLVGDVIYAKRASIKEYTMKAPEARDGYKFKYWELVSDRKNVTINGQTGIAYKYIAVYEKIK